MILSGEFQIYISQCAFGGKFTHDRSVRHQRFQKGGQSFVEIRIGISVRISILG